MGNQAILAPDGKLGAKLPAIHYGVLPICLRGHHARSYRWFLSLPHEFLRLDAFRAALADLQLLHRRFLALGRWLFVPDGSY